jgi:magnesium-dependent phosphatase 1
MSSVFTLLLSLPLILGFQSIALPLHGPRMTRKAPASQLYSKAPKLIVFDLDNTLWTPELYTLRKLERSNKIPVAGKDVKLFPGSKEVIDRIRKGEFGDTQFAVASRTKSGEWAKDLLGQFGLWDLFQYVEIFPGNKKAHFENIRQASGIDFKDMLFFDDARDGKYGNCAPVSAMGVLSAHCPGGLHEFDIFEAAMQRFQEWDRAPNTIVEWDGSVKKVAELPSGRQEGVVKTVNHEKGYGFIRYDSKNSKEVFFHSNNLPDGVTLEQGDEVSFSVERNSKSGKLYATDIATSKSADNQDTIEMRVFSMNLPFAALLANGYKDLESRNGTMFVPYPEGTQMLLHVGQRIYPDGNKHLEIMKSGGLNDQEIQELKSLPKGFSKGAAVAILELGKTYETTVEERSDPETQRRIAAFGADSGLMATEIKKVAYLKRPVKVSGKGGVFKANIPQDVLPDGWLLSPEIQMRQQAASSGNKNQGSSSERVPIYEISG